MKKSLIVLFVFLLGNLLGCNSLKMNYDLTDLEECILKIQDDDESTECSSDELVTVFLAYQENYQEYFPEETELLPFITNAGSSSTAGWNFSFWFRLNDEIELDESLVKTYRDIYNSIVKDFKSLLKENSIWFDFLITGENLAFTLRISYIYSNAEEQEYSGVLALFEKYETVTLEDIENSFEKWKYFLDMDGFYIRDFSLGKNVDYNQAIRITFYQSEDEKIHNKFEIRSSYEGYVLPASEIEKIILDNTRGYSLYSRE